MYAPSDTLPDHSRIWIYQCSKELTGEEIQSIERSIVPFLESWTAHNQSLRAGYEIRYNRFLVLVIDEKTAGASGCSIDKSVHFIQSMENELNVSFFDRLNFAYKAGGKISTASRAEFEKLFSTGVLNAESIVFNNLVQTKKELNSNWEIPFRESWHKNLISA